MSRGQRASGRRIAVGAVLVSSVLLTGCWHQIPLNKTGLVPTLAVDLGPKGGYTVTAEVIFPPGLPPPGPAGGGGGGSSQTPVFLRSASAATVSQAVSTLMSSAYLYLDFTHLREVVVSEALARAGLVPALQYIARSPAFAQTGFLLVASRGSAAGVLRASEKQLPKPDEVLSETVHWSRINTPYSAARMYEAISEMPLTGMEFATAGVAVGQSQNPQSAPVVLSAEAIFRRDRLVGWLQGATALGYATWMKWLRHQGVVVSTRYGPVSLDLTGASRGVRVIADGTRAPRVDASLRLTARVASTMADPALWDSLARARAIQQAAAALIRQDVTAAIRQVQADGADVLGLGEYVRVYDPAYWNRVRGSWDTGAFRTLPVDVRVQVKITSVGEMFCPLLSGC